jgi:hypothetical protein
VGAVITYSDTMETELVDVTSSSEVLSLETGVSGEAAFFFGPMGMTMAASIGYAGEFEKAKGTEKGEVKVRSRSFSLGDADDGDYFDVQVSSSVHKLVLDLSCCRIPTDLPGSRVQKFLLHYDERPEQVCGHEGTWNLHVICRYCFTDAGASRTPCSVRVLMCVSSLVTELSRMCLRTRRLYLRLV